MYLDIKNIKVLQARAVGAKVGSDIIEPIMNAIKDAAAEGNDNVKITYKDYNISNFNLPFVCYWARICGFEVSAYDMCMYIKWNY